MKNILLLTDFSGNAQNAIRYSLELFRGESVNFHILNVQKVSNYRTSNLITSSSTASIYDSVIKDSKKEILMLIEKLSDEYKNEPFTFDGNCDYDDFISAIKQHVKSKGTDLIIMGTNGATAATEVIFGSNTVNVIRKINCPVLTIPDNYKFSKPHSVLYVIESNEDVSKQSLSPMLYLIDKFNSDVSVLLLEKEESNTNHKNKKEALDVLFKGIEHNFYTITNIPTDIAIDSFVQIHKVDLSAKIINKKTFLKRLLKGSKTDEITYKTRVPLLIMHS